MNDGENLAISFFVGILISILMMKVTLNESDRWKVNQCFKSLIAEIMWNLNKYRLIKKDFSTTKEQWEVYKTLNFSLKKWSDELLITESGTVYTPFKFDAFNYYKNSEIPFIFGIGLDYRISELYGASKKYNYNFVRSLKNIHENQNNSDLINIEMENLKKIHEDYSAAFFKFSNSLYPDIEKLHVKKIIEVGMIDWYLGRKHNLDVIFEQKKDIKNAD